MIRDATSEDVTQLVEIHSLALPRDLLPRLGRPFLADVFFPTALRSEHASVLVHDSSGTIDSFGVFAYEAGHLTKEVLADRLALARHMIRRVFLDWGLFVQAAGYLMRSTLGSSEVDAQSPEDPGEVYLIATHPRAQGRGLGTQVLAEGLRRLSSQKGECLAKTSSPEARKFYLRNGFAEIGVEYRGRRKLAVLAVENLASAADRIAAKPQGPGER